MDSDEAAYEIVTRSQAGADELLHQLGAIEEIEDALLGHCEAERPAPSYKPQAYKKSLVARGWIPEARVPPYRSDIDDWPINERYDALKFFDLSDREVGVAIEIEGWEINNDLLKFRRGYARGQIAAGVILQPNYATLHYCFERMRHLNEPLFGEIPILFVCPRGPGLEEWVEPKKRMYQAYRFPRPKG